MNAPARLAILFVTLKYYIIICIISIIIIILIIIIIIIIISIIIKLPVLPPDRRRWGPDARSHFWNSQVRRG